MSARTGGPVQLQALSQRDLGVATVRDVTYAGVSAFLVGPRDASNGAAVLFLHWLASSGGDRGQFLDEAVELAAAGVTSLLPQGVFPWTVEPTTSGRDLDNIALELSQIQHGLEIIRGLEGVDPGRVGIVGHDFGAMYGALIAATEARPRAMVLSAATSRWSDWFLPFWRIDEDRFDYQRTLSPLDPIGQIGLASPTPLLFQFATNDFYIAEMTAREFYRAASEPKELRLYPADHSMTSPPIQRDRSSFLAQHLGFGDRLETGQS